MMRLAAKSGSTIPVHKLTEHLGGKVLPYAAQFEKFYAQSHEFSVAEFGLLRSLLYELRQLVVFDRLSEGLEINNPEILSLLQNHNLAVRTKLPANFVIPLYDLIMSKTHPVGFDVPPRTLMDASNEDEVWLFLHAILQETDRYQSVIRLALSSGEVVNFLPGRLWFVSNNNSAYLERTGLSYEAVRPLLLDLKYQGKIREMNWHERITKLGREPVTEV